MGPPDVTESEVHRFFKESVTMAMGNRDEDDDPILSVYINHERRFAFVEFRTMEVCTACLALDGINLLGRGKVKVKRPNDYNPSLAPPETQIATLPRFDISKLGIVSGSVPDGPNKIFIGGLPYHLTEDQVMELLSAFGQVRAFHLVKADASAITSKGYCFVEYIDSNVTPIAVMGLNGMDMGGGKTLSARMAAARGTMPAPLTSAHGQNVVGGVDIEALLNVAFTGNTAQSASNVTDMASAALEMALGNGQAVAPAPVQTKILVLLNMVTDDDLCNDEDHEDLLEEVKAECQNLGNLLSIQIPRPTDPVAPSAVKKIFIEYDTVEDSANAERELSGRKFGASIVTTSFFSEEDYAAGKLS